VQVHAGNGFGDGGQRHVGFDLGAYCQQNGGGFCGSDSPRHEARLFAQPLSVLGESSSTGSGESLCRVARKSFMQRR
jgi:hypothetical protein